MVFPRNWPNGPKPTMPILRVLEATSDCSDETDIVDSEQERCRFFFLFSTPWKRDVGLYIYL